MPIQRATRIPLYLHIGHAKVASSTIQAALADNLAALRAAGYLVADSELGFPAAGPLHGFPITLVAELCERGEAGLRAAVERFAAVQRELEGRPARLVVSSESLAAPETEFLGKALRHAFSIHVVYYVRRQDEWLVSAWNQWGSKQGLSLRDFCSARLDEGFPDFHAVASRWEAVADSLHVRPLHRDALLGGDIVTDFFAAIGAPFPPERPDRVNPSFDLGLLEVFQDSPFLFANADDNSLRDWLRAVLPEGFPAEKPVLDADLLERIEAVYAPGNRRLHARYFPQVSFRRVFGPRSPAVSPEPAAVQHSLKSQVERLRRVVGLQFALLLQLNDRLPR